MKTTQIEMVKTELRHHGEVSRNWCLGRYVSRLGAIICLLKKEGWQFETVRREGDYVYKLVESPKRLKYEFELIDGVARPKATYVPV